MCIHKNKLILIFLTAFLFISSGAFCQDGAVVNNAVQGIDTITLDIKGMDILDVLKIISMKSGLNIVAGKNVTGRVTIFLKDVDIWDALQIVLVANNLAYEKQGNIINVMTDRDYELIYGEKFYDKKKIYIAKLRFVRVTEVSKVLMQAKTNVGKIIVDEGSNTIVIMDIPSSILQMKQMIDRIDVETQSRVFSLNYAKAEDIEKKVTELVTKNLGFIKIDVRTNKIAVTDLPEQLDKIENVIKEFDQKDLQVMIEAKILEVTLNDNFQMGINWDVIADKYLRLTQNLKLNITDGGTIKIGTLAGGGDPQVPGDYSGLINALKEVGEVNTLSNPKIMALNNQESKILVGFKQPYSTKSVVSSQQTTTTAESVTFVDLGVKLYVTPTINGDGFITMKIKPEVSSKSDDYPMADGTKIPVISTTEAETTIMVKDGATVVIAGLIKDSLGKTSRKVPFLGDIPLLGHIFSNVSDIKKKEEIVVLLTPHIITGESIFTETERWRRQEALLDTVKGSVEKENQRIKDAKKRQAMPKKEEKVVPKKAEIKKDQKKELPEKKKEMPKKKKEVPAKKKNISEKKEPKLTEEQKAITRVDKEKAAVIRATASGVKNDDYFLNMKRKIQNAAKINFSQVNPKGDCAVKFSLDSSGNLIGDPVIISEDNNLVGDVMVESVKIASPFGSFPEEFDAQGENFTVNVSFQPS